MTFTHSLPTNNYGPSKFIVDPSAANGTHITIASAITSASSGDTIFIRPGTYTENLTLKAGVNLTAYGCDGIGGFGAANSVPNVIILGTVTASYNGSCALSGIQLKTNGAAALAVSGASTSHLKFVSCSIHANDFTGMTINANANFNTAFYSCSFFVAGTNNLFSVTIGALSFNSCQFSNGATTVTASTIAASRANFIACIMTGMSITTSTTGSIIVNSCYWSFGDHTLLTTAGTGTSEIYDSHLEANTSTAISIGTGTTVQIANTSIQSTNTNAISGAGTLSYTNISFTSTSSTINPTTLTKRAIIANLFGITTGTNPAAGFVGEQLSSTGTTVNLPDNTATNITSVNLTAGIWDVSALVQYTPTTFESKTFRMGISTNSASFTGVVDGTSSLLASINGSGFGLSIPSFRVSIAATTTYYLVALCDVSTGTCTGSGTIRATRVA